MSFSLDFLAVPSLAVWEKDKAVDFFDPLRLSSLRSWICGLLHDRVGWIGGIGVIGCSRRRAKQQGQSNDPCDHGCFLLSGTAISPTTVELESKKIWPRLRRSTSESAGR